MLVRDKLHPNTKTSRDICFVDPAVPGIQFLPLVLVPPPQKKNIKSIKSSAVTAWDT